MEPTVKIIECPRDAMQGLKRFIPTAEKTAYINALLKVGFHTIDFGSFVSARIVPQMADTEAVLQGLKPEEDGPALLAIVANLRGAETALRHPAIRYLGFPFSISETFQLRNTNKTIPESLGEVKQIQRLCKMHGRELVVYISMGFGNPYGDPYNKDVVLEWAARLSAMDISIISLADTVGVADPATIAWLFSHVIPAFPQIEWGAHFHSAPHNWEEKIAAAWENGCRRFDSTLGGLGGCPMAKDELTGNIATENLLDFFERKGVALPLRKKDLQEAEQLASLILGS